VGDREVTAILYFNDEWRADRDGGSLRVFHPYTPVNASIIIMNMLRPVK
jgi:Rps23 Pro-64 3,4-dihydroxylase Tpa1-like proline 4-hydroxylase